jgi:hypothetical protein
VSDGKGGKIRVKKENPNKRGGRGRGAKDGRGGKGGKGRGKGRGGVAGDASSSEGGFSDCTTDSEAVDLENMTEEEKTRYLADRAVRRATREQKRKEKYGDAYEEIAAKHKKCVRCFQYVCAW